MWNYKFNTFELNLGFVMSKENHYVYAKIIYDQVLIIILYMWISR